MTRHKKKFPAFLWHRRLGLLLVFFIIILAVTGIMLNHTNALQLGHTKVTNAIVLSLYEINPHSPILSYQTKEHIFSQLDEQIYFDHKKLLSVKQQLRGVTNTGEIIILVLSQDVILLSREGELIDRYALAQKTEIEHIGIYQNKVIIKMMDQTIWQADDDIINWLPVESMQMTWAPPIQIKDNLKQQLLEQYRGEGLPLERIVLDIHSGRIFGKPGVFVMDAVAIIMLFLSLSGIWMWWQRRLKQRSKQRRKVKH
jgi:PepSY-associated transmembrane protein